MVFMPGGTGEKKKKKKKKLTSRTSSARPGEGAEDIGSERMHQRMNIYYIQEKLIQNDTEMQIVRIPWDRKKWFEREEMKAPSSAMATDSERLTSSLVQEPTPWYVLWRKCESKKTDR